MTPSIDKRECRSLSIGGITNYPPFTGPLTGLQALLSVCFPRIAFICLHHHSSYNVSQRTADSYGLGMPLTTPVSLPLSPKPPLSPLPPLPSPSLLSSHKTHTVSIYKLDCNFDFDNETNRSRFITNHFLYITKVNLGGRTKNKSNRQNKRNILVRFFNSFHSQLIFLVLNGPKMFTFLE